MRVFSKCLSMYVCVSSPFGFEGKLWDAILLVSDLCLSLKYCTLSKLYFSSFKSRGGGGGGGGGGVVGWCEGAG